MAYKNEQLINDCLCDHSPKDGKEKTKKTIPGSYIILVKSLPYKVLISLSFSGLRMNGHRVGVQGISCPNISREVPGLEVRSVWCGHRAGTLGLCLHEVCPGLHTAGRAQWQMQER